MVFCWADGRCNGCCSIFHWWNCNSPRCFCWFGSWLWICSWCVSNLFLRCFIVFKQTNLVYLLQTDFDRLASCYSLDFFGNVHILVSHWSLISCSVRAELIYGIFNASHPQLLFLHRCVRLVSSVLVFACRCFSTYSSNHNSRYMLFTFSVI